MDCSLPGSSIHGIFQARVLEWGAIALSAVDFKFLKDKIQGQIFESEQQLKIILHPHVRISTTLKTKKKTQTNKTEKQNKTKKLARRNKQPGLFKYYSNTQGIYNKKSLGQ